MAEVRKEMERSSSLPAAPQPAANHGPAHRHRTWDLPQDMLRRQARRELDRAMMELQSSGFSNDQIRTYMNELHQNAMASTSRALKEHFILERIAEEEKIDAEPGDYDTEIDLIADQADETPRRSGPAWKRRASWTRSAIRLSSARFIELIPAARRIPRRALQPAAGRGRRRNVHGRRVKPRQHSRSRANEGINPATAGKTKKRQRKNQGLNDQ